MKNLNPLEKEIEAKVVAYAKNLKMLVYKFTSPSRRSVPDRMFITPKGVVFFIEFKRLGQTCTPAQHVEGDKIRQAGIQVFIVDNVEGGKVVINHMLDPLGSY